MFSQTKTSNNVKQNKVRKKQEKENSITPFILLSNKQDLPHDPKQKTRAKQVIKPSLYLIHTSITNPIFT